MILQNSSIAFLTRFIPWGIQVVVFKEIIDKIGVHDGKYRHLSSVVGITVAINAYFYGGTVNFSEKNLEFRGRCCIFAV